MSDFGVRWPQPLLPGTAVCGGLGRVDKRRVRQIAEHLGPGVREVHSERRSMLMASEPVSAWQSSEERGTSWGGDGPAVPGLVIRGRRRFVRASACGLPAIFWMAAPEATYFASRIEPLALAAEAKLSVDWEAWACIVRLGYTVGSRTAFREIRRLEPEATLEHGACGALTTSSPWSWAQVELVDSERASEALHECLLETIAPLRERRVVVPLSGGADSRTLAACVARIAPRAVSAITVAGQWGESHDRDIAPLVADRLGFPHREIPSDDERYWENTVAIAEGSEHQQALEWGGLGPLSAAMAGEGGEVAVDGLAGDIAIRGKWGEPPKGSGKEARFAHLWRSVEGRSLERLLAPRRVAAIDASAREQLLEAVEPFFEHPSSTTLGLLRTRTTRGMSAGATCLTGASHPALVPYLADPVARAALSCPPEAKLDGGLYRRLLSRLAPELDGIPLTSYGPALPSRRQPTGRESGRTTAEFVAVLAESPLRGRFRGRLREAVDTRDPAALGRRVRNRTLNGLVTLGLWLERHRERLADERPGPPFG